MGTADRRRGLPLLPTLLVLLAVPVLIGFGVWQLQRMHWKDALLADLARNAGLPVASLEGNFDPETMLFRRVWADLRCEGAPQERAGRNLAGQSGYSVVFVCNTAHHMLSVNAGWAPRPGLAKTIAPPSGRYMGVLAPSAPSGPSLLGFYLSAAPPPLLPSAPPSVDTISNNHLSYAVQWFSFAAILAVIYALWLRRWKLAPVPPQD